MISGEGRTLQNLLEWIDAGRLRAVVAVVIASRESAGTRAARQRGIAVQVLPGNIPRQTLEETLHAAHVNWVVLAGYLFLVDIPPAWRGRAVNIHPALLPRFGGKGMYGRRVHDAVLAAGEPVSGCTVHMADEEFDRGRIILQRQCPVLPGDTPDTLAQRVFELEREAYPAALTMLIEETGAPQPATGSARTKEHA